MSDNYHSCITLPDDVHNGSSFRFLVISHYNSAIATFIAALASYDNVTSMHLKKK